jgi:hypothetical protein
MSKQYSPKQFFRKVPNKSLKQYFGERNVLTEINFDTLSETDVEPKYLLSEDNRFNEGGAALTAYARMQFEEMSGYERNEIKNALLKYCELDTMAMVMLYEGWREMLTSAQASRTKV